jgi:hypothetical protein
MTRYYALHRAMTEYGTPFYQAASGVHPNEIRFYCGGSTTLVEQALVHDAVRQVWSGNLLDLVFGHFGEAVLFIRRRRKLHINLDVGTLFEHICLSRAVRESTLGREHFEQVHAGHPRFNVLNPSEHTTDPICVLPVNLRPLPKRYDFLRSPCVGIVLNLGLCVLNVGLELCCTF